MAKIVPHLWFDNQALEAAKFYVGLFEDSKILSTSVINDTPSGDAMTVTFELAGIPFAAISAGPEFRFNPAISLMVACANKDEVNRLYRELIIGGQELMPLGEYPFSEWYAWISDRFGLNWQILMVEDLAEHRRIQPSLLFGQGDCGKVGEALDFYGTVFDEATVGYTVEYAQGEASDSRAKIKYAQLKLFDLDLVLMDDGTGGNFMFNESFSFIINCETQDEVDYYWEKLSADKDAEACGWLKDKFGLSWQVVPTILGELMSSATPDQAKAITEAFLKMKKFDIAQLVAAKNGG